MKNTTLPTENRNPLILKSKNHLSREKVVLGHNFILIMAIISILMIASVTSSALFLGKTSCYASSVLTIFVASNACDNDDGTNWISTGTTNEFVIVNLTTAYDISNVSIKYGNYPFAGHIDVWNGAAWVAYANFTEPTANTNQTYVLGAVFYGDRIRVFETTTTKTNVGVLEIWPQGAIHPIPTFSDKMNSLIAPITSFLLGMTIVFAIMYKLPKTHEFVKQFMYTISALIGVSLILIIIAFMLI